MVSLTVPLRLLYTGTVEQCVVAEIINTDKFHNKRRPSDKLGHEIKSSTGRLKRTVQMKRKIVSSKNRVKAIVVLKRINNVLTRF